MGMADRIIVFLWMNFWTRRKLQGSVLRGKGAVARRSPKALLADFLQGMLRKDG
jgi:hypothetical protein